MRVRYLRHRHGITLPPQGFGDGFVRQGNGYDAADGYGGDSYGGDSYGDSAYGQDGYGPGGYADENYRADDTPGEAAAARRGGRRRRADKGELPV